MRHFALGSVLLLASAQLGLAATISVTVGGPNLLKFTPDHVNASVGDEIIFSFQQKNHTVTQSSLKQPCTPLQNGFDSGFMPVAAGQTGAQPAKLTVKDTTPIYAYCRQGNHCSQKMVFTVNASPEQLLEFQANAAGGSSSSPPPTVSSTTAPVPSSSAVTPSSKDHRVVVGGTGLTFTPSNITAQPGETVTFEFHQKNHTVTASSFDDPCRELTSSGFDSGFKPVADGATPPTYVLQINDTKPIWAFCKQGNHCSQGMVFAVNAVATSDKNFTAFQDKAKGLTSGPYSGAAWRPSVGFPSIAVVLCLSAAGWLL